ncbi:synaptojanin-1-like isoform X2 [Corticium candelabrum]|uniref:synaptojanin-1-like isoform X2 n=1 Tax=Corticium candelabrum TaxID=121492 RepID=UPI002E276B99|nr:synaptojanin-1-like isoform X2 [Corticium candelabrum]
MGLGKLLRVSQKQLPLSILLEYKKQQNALLFESDIVAVLSQHEADNIRKQYVKSVDAYSCLGVLRVKQEFGVGLYLILVTGCEFVGRIQNSEIYRVTAVTHIHLNKLAFEDSLTDVRRLLSSGTFYFSRHSDGCSRAIELTQSMQSQLAAVMPDDKFLWNKGLFGHLERFGVDCSSWTVNIICGSVDIKTVYAGEKTTKFVVLSRLSCERAGTRFNTRGVDDDGNVANFVESEQIILTDDGVTSFIQLRGTVPLFWEQPGFQTGSHKIKMSRGYEASAPAFERHFTELLTRYGPQLIINLLGLKEGESMLSSSYVDHLKHSRYSNSDDIHFISFDYHQQKGKKEKMNELISTCKAYMLGFGYYHEESGAVMSTQVGTVRVNCMDCIDRTNAIQTILAQGMLPAQLKVLGLSDKPNIMARFDECLKTLWSSNGDHISKIYAGTGALDGRTKVGKLVDGAKSVSRTIQNNFMDNTKQEAIDVLLQGNVYAGYPGWRSRALLPFSSVTSSPGLVQELCARYKDYTTTSSLRVSVGTWNVNGGRHFRSIAFKHQSMHDWLLDAPKLKPLESNQALKLIPLSIETKNISEDECVPSRPPLPGLTTQRQILRSKSSDSVSLAVSTQPVAHTAAIEAADLSQSVDVFAIGFQELVNLSTSNIISASSTNKKEWGAELERVLSRDETYVLLTAEQLVGVCLYIFVRPSLLPYIRDVGVATVKTGLSGAAGNKGAVAIRFLVHASSVCFICGHLAAGQSNVKDRNQDFADISKRLAFARGYTADCHDYVFWCGDFNYRIDMPLSDVKDLVKDENWKILQAYDQLNVERKKGAVFQGFTEGLTNFPPTYKYDAFSDDYDTSEKLRTPAWTDRILWKRFYHSQQAVIEQVEEDVARIAAAVVRMSRVDAGQGAATEADEWSAKVEESRSVKAARNDGEEVECWCPGKLLYYNRGELKTSDHRPVVAIIEIEIEQVDSVKRQLVSDEVSLMMGPSDPTIVIQGQNDKLDEDESLDPVVLMAMFQSFGEVLMMRLLESKILITFKDARSAVASLELDGKEVEGVVISVTLKCTWPQSTSINTSSITTHSPSPDHHVPSRLTVLTSEHIQQFRSSPHTSPFPSPSQSPSLSPIPVRKQHPAKQTPGKSSPLMDSTPTSERMEIPHKIENEMLDTEPGVRIEITEADNEESEEETGRQSQQQEVETPLFDLSSDEEPVLSKKDESVEEILQEVEADLSRDSTEFDGEAVELDRIIEEGRRAMKECLARSSVKGKKPARPARPPQPKPAVTVEVPVVVREVSPVTSSKPPKPVATLPSVKRETKAQMATVSRPATKPARPEPFRSKTPPARPAPPGRPKPVRPEQVLSSSLGKVKPQKSPSPTGDVSMALATGGKPDSQPESNDAGLHGSANGQSAILSTNLDSKKDNNVVPHVVETIGSEDVDGSLKSERRNTVSIFSGAW